MLIFANIIVQTYNSACMNIFTRRFKACITLSKRAIKKETKQKTSKSQSTSHGPTSMWRHSFQIYDTVTLCSLSCLLVYDDPNLVWEFNIESSYSYSQASLLFTTVFSNELSDIIFTDGKMCFPESLTAPGIIALFSPSPYSNTQNCWNSRVPLADLNLNN